MSNLSPLDRSLHELGMLSAITDSRHQYLKELRRKTMDSTMKRCAFHILQINSNYVENISPCKINTSKRMSYRVKPYHMPVNKLFPVQNEVTNERTRTKSENSDNGNENLEVKDNEIVANVGLFKSKSLENINTSSLTNSSHDFKMELDDLKRKTEETTDVELVSSKIKCLNVSNK